MKYGIVLLFLLLPVLSFAPYVKEKPVLSLMWYYQIMPDIPTKTYTAIATYYNAVKGQTDSSPFTCADNTRITNPKKQRIVAISKPLEKLGVSFGDTLIVHSVKNPSINGIWIVHDRMNKSWKKNKVDFLLPHKTKFHNSLISFKLKKCGGKKKINHRLGSRWASG